jgi:integrase
MAEEARRRRGLFADRVLAPDGQAAETWASETWALYRFAQQRYNDLIEYKRVSGLQLGKNPVEDVPEKAREQLRSEYDRSTTSFIEKLADVKRVYGMLDEPLNVMYAVGVLAGLRPGEVRALRAESVWFDRNLIHVCESVRNRRLGPPKNGKVRDVLILESLRPVLES